MQEAAAGGYELEVIDLLIEEKQIGNAMDAMEHLSTEKQSIRITLAQRILKKSVSSSRGAMSKRRQVG
jgi:hypothetical protein